MLKTVFSFATVLLANLDVAAVADDCEFVVGQVLKFGELGLPLVPQLFRWQVGGLSEFHLN